MPIAYLKSDTEPPNIPGLYKYLRPGTTNEWELRGDVSALEAAGVDRKVIQTMIYGVGPMPIPYNGFTLRPFQSLGVARLQKIITNAGGAILADEMGLGKTPQIAVLAHQMVPDSTALFVCPAGVRHQWAKWCQMVGGPPFCDLGPPSDKKNIPAWTDWQNAKQPRWAAVSYPMMSKALGFRRPRLISFDEPHANIQSRGNVYIKTMWRYGAQIQYKAASTGSPYLSEPAGLWSLLNVLLGLKFGLANEYDRRYCDYKEDPYPDRSGVSNASELAQRLTHYMVRRMKADVASELPKVTRSVRWVEGTAAARGAMANLKHSQDGLRRAMEPTLMGKIPAVVDLCDEADAPTVVFCWRRSDCEAVSNALAKAKMESLVIHGEYGPDVRHAMVNHAAKKRCHVVTTYGASSTGLDGLQLFSSNMVLHAIDPVPATLLQSIARLDRIGQTLPVTVTATAMRDSIDEITIDRSYERLDAYQKILGSDVSGTALKDALMKGGMGDITNDAVLQALFEDLT